MITHNEMIKCVLELKKIFPDFESYTNNWLVNANVHGHKQSEGEKKCMEKFSKIMKQLEVI